MALEQRCATRAAQYEETAILTLKFNRLGPHSRYWGKLLGIRLRYMRMYKG